MKRAAWLLLIPVALALIFTGWQWLLGELILTAQGVETHAASEWQEEYDAVYAALSKDALLGVQLNGDAPEDGRGCVFKVYTLRLANRGLIPADMVEIEFASMPDDIAYWPGQSRATVPAQSEREVQVYLLTRETASPARDLIVTYYLWGHPQRVKFTVGG